MAEKYGFIITVEEYCGNIPAVAYACSDGDLVLFGPGGNRQLGAS